MPETTLLEPVGSLLQVLARLLSSTPAIVPLLALPLIARGCYRAWAQSGNNRAARWVGATVLVMGLSDGLLLFALPRLGLSFGSVGLPWLGMLLVRAGLAWVGATLVRRLASGWEFGTVSLILALNLAFLACEVYALYFEPFNLSLSTVHVSLPETPDPLRFHIVQLSDWHIERTTRRERAVLETVERLKPDLILLTGDYLNLSYIDDARARQDAHAVLRQLDAPYGVYAISGTPVVDTKDAMAAIFDDLDNVTVLHDEIVSLDLGGQTIHILGVANLGLERDRDSLKKLTSRLPPNAWTLLMYHTPDLIETAAELGVDLYLAGHTHGGQIRLPRFGAILTASKYGKRYEAGLYQVALTQLYVSRGIGMEGLGMPRVRFLCPPEIVEFWLMGESPDLQRMSP